jgi:hypothetical protein
MVIGISLQVLTRWIAGVPFGYRGHYEKPKRKQKHAPADHPFFGELDDEFIHDLSDAFKATGITMGGGGIIGPRGKAYPTLAEAIDASAAYMASDEYE